MGKSRAFIVLAAAVAIAAAPIASCLDATEIVIGLSANVDCATVRKNGTLVRIGSPANIDTTPTNAFTSYKCESNDATTMNDLGKLVIVPSGSVDSVVSIDIILGVDPAQQSTSCLPEASGKPCIYARRQISYLPHTHVYLPIELDASCAGNVCNPGVTTCKAGVCVPIDVDPNDCGTQCSTGPDAVPPDDSGPMIDSPALDSTIDDAPLETSTCTGTMCGNVCVDLATDKQNCGKCGFDCSGGTCIAGTCQLDATAIASCLVLYGNQVWIQGSSSIASLPINGGTPQVVANNTTHAIAAVPSHLAWFDESVVLTRVYDYSTNTPYSESGSAAFLVISPKYGYLWSDPGIGYVMFQPLTGAPSQALSIPKQALPIAVADKNLYVSEGTQVVWKAFSSQPITVGASSSSAIIVDDPAATTPNVFYVEKGTSVTATDYQLGNPKTAAVGTKTITALAWDASKSTLVANMGTEIASAQNGTFVTTAKTVSAAPKCVAVDANAVYWLEKAGGVYKHYKP